MSDILRYKFYLNFKNEGSFGRIQISEPLGFDGAGFVVEQESKRYGRDVYRINEEINLSFHKGFYEPSEQRQLPNGTVIHNLTHGFEELVESRRLYGFESDVDFEIQLNDITFIASNLDFQTSETDGFTYFSCKAVQTQDRQLIKRRADVTTDVFSTEDLDGNTVTPVETQNILLKAKPVTQVSEWNKGFDFVNERLFAEEAGGQDRVYYYYNNCNSLINSGIDFSLSFLEKIRGSIENPNLNLADNFRYVRSLNSLSNIQIRIRNLEFSQIIDTDNGGDGYSSNKFVIQYGQSIDNLLGEIVIDQSFVTDSQGSYSFSIEDETYTINGIPRDNFIWIYFVSEVRQSSDTPFGNPRIEAFTSLSDYSIDIEVVSTAIDTVIKGVRYIDVIKANLQRINGYEVQAPKLDVGGIYYNQFLVSGNLIKQRADLPFNVKFKDLMEDLMEVNSDYQITDKLYINQYSDFYPNKEIAAFLSSPDSSFKFTFNERYAINEFKYEYKEFEQDRDEENTTDAIHTQSEWLTSNKQVENTKEIQVGHIRDAYKIESIRKLASKETTSTRDDNKVIALDVTTLAPNSKGGFSALMTHNIDEDGNVQLLKDADLSSWTLLGFTVGGTFEILSNDNQGEYTVAEIENTVITLTPVNPSSQTFTGESFTQVEYPFTNVLFTNRTNEGLLFSENLLNANNYANLRYSIKRNIGTWKPYLATASIDENGVFRNTFFKDNGEAITRFEGEPENIQENANINNIELGDAILTPNLYETRLLVPFKDMSSVIEAIDTVNEDNTIGGFIRCIDNNNRVIKLYPQKLDYTPSTETLTLIGEERFEGSGIDIVISGETVIINEVGYSLDELSDPFYEFDGDYFKIYDVNKLAVITPTRYTDITVNGLNFNSASELLGYLLNL